ncbi:low specificity L-threonine aldolase [Alisedimentitalea sp. MJ-SS2]|uniref:threonine aldolase family protein n=1 Tax=Aliisedimentitalea sp. MJ-SS2 TaxID=3049795 RepID=UPI002912516B|nr:low specificity L-threonine aldolase [Alisedimentitalea sp. MJ-SS2]MDU8927277.1 low specificity L-threonine aldolase [Alisedimentitalea sp. MJ-SS2]
MFFASDNAGPAHPQVIQALADVNSGYAVGYGAEPGMDRVRNRLRDVFEAPKAEVFLVATGTTANSLALATLTQPWETIFCSPTAHIHEDECNAPEFYTGGAKLTIVGTDDKMAAASLRASIEGEETRGVHGPQRGPVSITQVTERGQIYTLDELSELTATAHEYGLKSHLDGARFANALVALDCTPAEMTWKLGIDAVSFGGTKNGCLGVEAVLFFDPGHAWEFELRRKRGGHLFSKHRYLSAQMGAYLTDDLWLDSARRANAACTRLATGLRSLPGVSFDLEPQANIIFLQMPRAAHQRLRAGGAEYYVLAGNPDSGAPDEMLPARLVCDWSISDAQIDQFIALARG